MIVPGMQASADVALNHLPLVDQINIANELYRDLFSIAPPQRKILVTNILVPLEFLESEMIRGDVFELSDFPKLATADFLKWIIEQLEEKWIDVGDLTGFGIENQDSVLSGFKQAAIPQFRSP